MQDTPDLSKIVNLIMQNPAIIEQISSLMKSEEEAPAQQPDKTEASVSEEASVSATPPTPSHRSNRRELLSAMKPYLSENRRSALDYMSSILEIIELMKK